jgi:glycosyltransferase involved in cell wall biosynthesis
VADRDDAAALRTVDRDPHAEPLRIAVLGMSLDSICGARDHATLLTEELQRRGARCTTHWLTRTQRSARASRAEIRAWLGGLATELRSERPDVAIVHYSVFSYAHAGVPLFVRPLFGELRRAGIPTVTVAHELAYSWRSGGARGKVWALTQRAALVAVMRASAAMLVTTDERARWIESRRWLPRRPVAFAPVFSNLPPPAAAVARARATVGLFGYAYDTAATPLVLDALRRVVDGHGEARLLLLGAPGGGSSAGRRWREAADARGLADALSFTGTLSAQELSDALASCELLLFGASAGPSSRKGTLAASLASGRPVVAVDGPNRWEELAGSGAALIVAPNADALARAVGGLLADEAEREAQGARARAFSRERMSVGRTADAVSELIESAGVRAP